ncbi:hypothetical protein [Streptomyces sp. URMC 123]|uniref:hypothetical protein n=1 Tax=Streptomyces sp. URMC 123 TaxID=3423403 RepID=UPI003F1AEE78
MSQQGEQNGSHRGTEDDWWRDLYDESAADVGPAPASDSLEDRFDSALRTVAARAGRDTHDPSARGRTTEARTAGERGGPHRPRAPPRRYQIRTS